VSSNLLLAASLPLLLASQSSGSDWTQFSPAGGGFTVLMPGTPTEHTDKLATKAGSAEVSYFLAESMAVTYVVSCSKFAKEAVKPETLEKRLDNARDGAVESSGGNLKSEKALKLGPHPGRELLLQGSKAFVRTRIYAVGNRLYQTMVVSKKENAHAADAAKFLESFKIVK
jgi:hypothetical protein